MAKNPPDERLVYLALKGVFKGADAQIRKAKKVHELVQRHQHEDDIINLLKEHNIENLCSVAKILLEQQIFESTLKAQIRFPEVFEVSPSQSAERAISASEAAKTEADAIQCAAEGCQIATAVNEHGYGVGGTSKGKEIVSQDVGTRSQKRMHSQSSSPAPSLYPVYLPFAVQHRLLVRVQHTLERACYSFGQKKLGGVLQREGWDCAEAVELNRWPKIFLIYQGEFSVDDLMDLGKPFPELLDSIIQLRHAAVHRIRLSANSAIQFIVDAESLAKLLGDDISINAISRLRRETQLTIEELKRNKDLLESRLAETRKYLAAKKAELERQELAAVANMLKEDREYLSFAGENLEHALDLPPTVILSKTATEEEPSSETDFDESLYEAAPSSQKCKD